MTIDMLPTITLVTPSYNQVETLEATIESVLSQEYPRLQYVIMDGGSTDGSVDIIKKYEDRLFHWESKTDGGLYKALNDAFSKTDGEIMGWINANDFLFPNSLNKLAYLFCTLPETEWLHGLGALSGSDGMLAHVDSQPGRVYTKNFAKRWKNAHCRHPKESTFWRRRLWNFTGASFNTNLQFSADLSLWHTFLSNCNPLSVRTLLGSRRSKSTTQPVHEKNSYDTEAHVIARNVAQGMASGLAQEVISGVQEIDIDLVKFNGFCRAHRLVKTPVAGVSSRETQVLGILKVAQNTFTEGPTWLGKTLAHEAGDALSVGHDLSWFPAKLPLFGGVDLNAELQRETTFVALQDRIRPDLTKEQLSAAIHAYEAEIGCVRRCHVKSLWYAKLLFVANRDDEGREFVLNSLRLNGVYRDALELAAIFFGPTSFAAALKGAKRLDPQIEISRHQHAEAANSLAERFSASARSLLKEVRLESVYTQLASGQYELLSVDFFDTLVGRFVAQPKDAFRFVGEQLFSAGLLREECSVSMFASLRQEAESKARFNLSVKAIPAECRLSEIYENLAGFLIDVPKAMRVEIEVEKALCFLNPAIAALVDWFVERGGRVVISSDMYLSSACLHEILVANSFDPARFEKTFVSSESRSSKNKGTLFDLVVATCNVHPSKVFHIGDHSHSDVKMPQSKGISAFYYAQSDRTVDVISEREKFLQKEQPSLSLGSLRFIGYNLRSQIEPSDNQAYQIGMHTIGPALTLYAEWVVRSCREKNLTSVLCIMREGGLLSTMVQRAAAHLRFSLRATRLYASRSALRLASLGAPTILGAMERCSKRGGATLLDLFQIFDLPSELMPLFQTDKGGRIDTVKFISAICNHPELVALIERKSQAKRKAAIAYLDGIIGSSKRIALVDLGFRATIQHFLVQVLHLEQRDVEVHGLYFASGPEISSRLIHGYKIDAFLDGLNPEFAQIRSFTAHPEIVEQTVSSVFQGTTLGYSFGPDGVSRPELETVKSSPEDISVRLAVQRGILDFQKLWMKTCKANPSFSKQLEKTPTIDLQREAFKMIQRLVTMPTMPESETLGGLVHDDNNGFDSGGKICPPSARLALRNSDAHRFVGGGAYWPNGVLGLENQAYFNDPINKLNFLRKN